MAEVGDNYVLTTGERGAARLELLDEVYFPATERACLAHGPLLGRRVADVGCGTGWVACWLAEQVGPDGHVTGVDVSADQLAIARARGRDRGLGNVAFVEASAYAPGLPRASFDLVFCQFLLIHLQRPAAALEEMAALLRPGGFLVAQESVLSAMYSDPPSNAYRRFAEESVRVAEALGVDYDFGRHLFAAVRSAGLVDVTASVHQPCFARGEHKRLWEYTFLEAAPGAVRTGSVTPDEVDELAAEFAVIGTDDTTLVVHPSLVSVSGKRPLDPVGDRGPGG